MRIALTVNFSPWSAYSGGGQRSTHNLACALVQRGHEVTVIYTKAGDEDVEPDEPPPYRVRWARIVGRTSRRDNPLRPLNAVTVAAELGRVLAEDGVQAVHGNGEEAALFGALQQRYRFVFVMTPRYPSYPAPLLRPGGPSRWEQAKLLIRDAKYLVLGAALRSADWVCPTSNSAARMVSTAFGVPRKKVRVIPNGVDPAFGNVRWSPDDTSDRPIVFFGRLERSKGVDVLVDALARLGDEAPRCTIVGRGEAEPVLRARISELGLTDRVAFHDWCEPRQLADIVLTASLVVLPSREESFGNAMAEAMVAGAPVISTRAGSIPELIEHDRTGILVDPGDANALADAITRLRKNPAHAAALAERAHETASERYTWPAVATCLEPCYSGAPR